MHYVLLILLLAAALFGPQLWVRHVMRRHAGEIRGLPGTGGEFARHLVGRLGLDKVTVEATDGGDHFDPDSATVRLSRSNYDGRSLTAVAIAAHEVGHAIQFHHNDARLVLRTRLAPLAQQLGRVSVVVAALAPLAGILLRHPVPFSFLVLIGVSGLLGRVALHLVTLPTEIDASFNKALPILREGGYIPAKDLPAVASVLRAASYTYVSAALADVLNLARWAVILLRR